MTRNPILVAILCAQATFAQPPNTASLTGRVTDTAGKPIAKATLLLVGGGRGPGGIPNAQPYRATTAADGAYSFTDLQPGAYNLQAWRAGYATGLLGAESFYELTGSLRLAASQKMTGVNFALAPAATISGRITDASGNPVADAQLGLWRHYLTSDGTYQTTRVNQISGPANADAITDNDGKYSIENVAPGTDYLSAGLVSGVPGVLSLLSLQGLGVTRFQYSQTQPEAWATTWFPHAIDGASASPIEIAAGRVITVDIQLRKTPVYLVKGQLVEAPPTLTREQGRLIASAPGPPLDQLRIGLLTAQGQPITSVTAINRRNGSFLVNGVPPGEYYLRAIAPGSGSPTTVGSQKITVVDRDIDVVFNLPAPVEIHGTLTSNAPLPPSIILQFTPAEFPAANSISVPLGSDGAFTMPGFMPGEYRVKAWAPLGNYLKSININGAEVATNSAVALASGPATLQIALGSPTGSIHANIRPDATGAIARYVTVVPVAPLPGIDWRVTWFAPPDELKDLPPGAYRLYAIDAADPSAIPADALKGYDNQSVTVTIAAGDPVTTTLRTIRMRVK